MLGRPGLRPGRHQLELEERRLADQLLGALRVLDAGQLDDDLVRALRLHRRLGDAELVDPVADDLERLVDDVVADALRLALIEGQDQVGLGVLARRHGETREALLHEVDDLLALLLVGETDADGTPLTLRRDRADLRVVQLALEIPGVAVDRVVDRLLDLDAVEEVGAALEVQAEADRLAPRPERRRGADERGDEEHDGRRREDDEQQHAVEHRSAHDFSRSFSRASTAGALCTDWIAARSTWTRTLGAISTVTTLSASVTTRPCVPQLITT